MKMIFNVEDKPKLPQLVIFALQQLLAVLAATIAVPIIIGNGLTPAAAMFGAGAGTLVYVLITKRKSPVFLGSSFAFIGSMTAAFAGGVSMQLGMVGLMIGAVSAGLVYVILALLVGKVGVGWINKLMPPVVIGPTVAIIGLSLAGNAISDLQKSNAVTYDDASYTAVICGLITLVIVIVCATYGSKRIKLVPFVAGILVGYVAAAVLTVVGNAVDINAFKLVDFNIFPKMLYENGEITIGTFFKAPDFVIDLSLDGFRQLNASYIATILVAYIPVAFVVFAEHVADHKNLSSVIGRDLLREPGLKRTLLGDGIGSMVGALFGGCPNTTYGESIGCVAITRNASTVTIIAASLGCMALSFFTPFIAFISSIPSCVMGGVCIALYGFIAVSGLKMLSGVDLDKNGNIFTVSVILIAGVGGLSISFGSVIITKIAVALILGILTNLMLSRENNKTGSDEDQGKDAD